MTLSTEELILILNYTLIGDEYKPTQGLVQLSVRLILDMHLAHNLQTNTFFIHLYPNWYLKIVYHIESTC